MRCTQIKLGNAVKAARRKGRLTQSELSEELGVSVRYLQNIENEGTAPSYAVLERIFDVLNISANAVFGPEEGQMTQEKEQLLYLINHRCTLEDIEVLLSVAERLVEEKKE